MKLCRFEIPELPPRVGMFSKDGPIINLTDAGVATLELLFESSDLEKPEKSLAKILKQNASRHALKDIQLLKPVERQEVWAVGVTYLRRSEARRVGEGCGS